MKTRQTLQFLAMIALLIWGGLFIFFYVTGRIERYVDVSFRTWALIAGLGLCVLALFNLATFRQKAASCCAHDHDHGGSGGCCGHDHGKEHDHSHGHDHDHEQTTSGLVTAILVLTVPVLMAARFSDNRFSAGYIDKWGKIERQIYQMRLSKERERKKIEARLAGDPAVAEANQKAAAGKANGSPPGENAVAAADTPPESAAPAASAGEEPATAPDVTTTGNSGGEEWGEFTMADLKRMVPQNDAGNFLLDVPQIFYTAGDDELMKVMEGIPIETTAQVMEETAHNPDGNRLRLFRLFIECCAADARPLSIPIEFPEKPAEYEEMGWVVVSGKLHYTEENGELFPVIRVDSMESTAEPMDMMMY